MKSIDNNAIIKLLSLEFPFTKAAAEYGDMLLGGKLVVGKAFEPIVHDVGNIDWNMQVTKSPTTFSLYLHMLAPVYFLAYAYYAKNNVDYYELARNITLSWVSYEETAETHNQYTWNDHAVSGRVGAFILLDMLAKEITGSDTSKDWIVNHIAAHGEWLTKGEKYKKNHNHGIIQDIALLITGYYINRTDFIDCSLARLKEQLEYAFPNNCAHVENSAYYHAEMLLRLSTVFDFITELNIKGSTPSNASLECRDGALDFLTYAMTPRGHLTAFGDSFRTISTHKHMNKHYGFSNHDNYTYALSMGTWGVKPEEYAKIFQKDGYAFFRSSWEASEFNKTTWIGLKSGFLSLTHKHRDDLSLSLYTKGLEVFCDPGMYNYMKGDINHDYMQSSFAHSSILVDNSSYPLGANLVGKAGILKTKPGHSFPGVQAYNNLYPGVFIDRSLIYVNENEFYIIDDIISNDVHEYAQNFHLSSEVKLVSHTPEGSIVNLTGTGYSMCIRQYEPVETVTIKSGETGNIATMSGQAIARNEIEETTSIQFVNNGTQTRFVTGFIIAPYEDIAETFQSPTPLSGDTLVIQGQEIDITPRIRPFPVEIDVEPENDQLLISPTESANNHNFYAHYLLEKKTGKVVGKTSYSKDRYLSLPIPEKGEYVLRTYHRTDGGDTSQWCSAEIAISGEPPRFFKYKKIHVDKSIPYVKERTVHFDGENYTFKLDMSIYPYDYDVAWFINKNGTRHFSAKGGGELEYTFDEPGSYVCYYKVRARYFYEIEMGNFAEIIIPEKEEWPVQPNQPQGSEPMGMKSNPSTDGKQRTHRPSHSAGLFARFKRFISSF
ncbi:MAG: heparinase II/III-family protein [Defluviitaleaceae bacterium]|nr:heparinase II/III-family protein [Defluviitaleaceae bacterium]